ncbi:C2H2-type domain-containing protein [Aphis craccivora]|uniref:C2H2-type domain-containing protein n=1 Tax=Aphis craccivora TaxID=307492 RepID=A0A6G0WJR9_APHCR|nr:C2H2-type domain-containing protein [Aphis craccivora]
MSKNPFKNTKLRKRGKKRGPVPIPQTVKPYCPKTMVRYDNTATGYKSLWACKMCMKVLLSEEATRAHVIICNTKTKKMASNPQPKKEYIIPTNICSTCNKEFARSVILKRHLAEHKPPSGLKLEHPENNIVYNVKVEADLIKKEYFD